MRFLISHRVHGASEKPCSGLVRNQSGANCLGPILLHRELGHKVPELVFCSVDSESSSEPHETGGAGERIRYSALEASFGFVVEPELYSCRKKTLSREDRSFLGFFTEWAKRYSEFPFSRSESISFMLPER
jgi:hypothetical protein